MFGKRLRQIRMENGFTQQKTADLLGITLRSYQKYEQGERSPSLDCLVKPTFSMYLLTICYVEIHLFNLTQNPLMNSKQIF